jgi:small-conductance mechanosensitive channel
LGTSAHPFYGNSLGDLIAAGIAAVAVWSSLWILQRFVASRYEKYSYRRSIPVRLVLYLIASTKQFFIWAVALYAAGQLLTFPPRPQRILYNAVLMLTLLQVGLWAMRALKFYLDLKEMERGQDGVFAGSLEIIRFAVGLLIWVLVVLLALENLGVNITTLLEGLGVGGIAVALALQNVLGDLFASMSIALDKPFVIGDFLAIDTFRGSVERIGIKSTRLRSESGEQIILSNADILKSRVRNLGSSPELRALATIRVAYATSATKIRGIPKLLESIVREQANARFERCHLKTLGESCLEFELSYFVQQPKINPLFDLQQAVNFRIIEEFRRQEIEFAYPTQHVLLEDLQPNPGG